MKNIIKPLVTTMLITTALVVLILILTSGSKPTQFTTAVETSTSETTITDPNPTTESNSTSNSTSSNNSNSASSTSSNSCIIQIDQSFYDVTQFRNMHSGGDVFVCGTDMTATFYSVHNARTKAQMARYMIPNPNTN